MQENHSNNLVIRAIGEKGYSFIQTKLKGRIESIKLIVDLQPDSGIQAIANYILSLNCYAYEIVQAVENKPEITSVVGVCGIANMTNIRKMNPVIFVSMFEGYEEYEAFYINEMTDKAFRDYKHEQVEMILFESEGILEEKIKQLGFSGCGKRDRCFFDNGKYQDIKYYKKFK